MATVPRNASSGSFEIIELLPSKSKGNANEDSLVELFADQPSFDYFFGTFKGITNVQAGKRPPGLRRMAVYNCLLGHLIRGEVSVMHIRLAPNSLLKASIKLKDSEKVFTVPLLDTENDGMWCQPRMYRGFHFSGFKGGNLSHRFFVDHLIITVEDVNTSFPMYTGGELLNINYKKATIFGLLDEYYVNVIKKKCTDVTLLPETKQSPLISTSFEYLDFTAVVLY